jgi:hypothetical protein
MPSNPHIARLPYAPEQLGRVDIDTAAPIIAGSMATVTDYTAGPLASTTKAVSDFFASPATQDGVPD